MRKNLKVQVTKGGITVGDVVIKTVDANDENVKKLFCDLRRMKIIIPGMTIDKVIITEEEEGEENILKNQLLNTFKEIIYLFGFWLK